MAHPYKAAAHKNDPKWVRTLDPYVEKNINAPIVEGAKVRDVDAVLRNYGGDSAATHRAADYSRPKGQD